MTTKREINDIIGALRAQSKQLREKEEFLLLKEDEVRHGGMYTYISFIQTKQELEVERSLLAGHAGMVRETIIKKKLRIDPGTQEFLAMLSGVERIHTIGGWPAGAF